VRPPPGRTGRLHRHARIIQRPRLVLPLALAQFICSYAASNTNVAITAIASDLHTTVAGVQTAITLFTLTMAALMIPGSKLTDIWGRTRCFTIGLVIYAAGALIALLAQGITVLIAGYSLLEGIGSALLIPPVYILITVMFDDVKTRARYFGMVSGAGGLGAAAGPLIGGLITSAISWRASFGLQVVVVAWIIVLARKIPEPARTGRVPSFDLTGAVLSAAGLFFVVLGLLQSRTYGFGASRQDFTIGSTVVIGKGSISPVWVYVLIGVAFLLGFFLHIRSRERKQRDVLLPLRVFRDKVSNLGLGTQLVQWLTLPGLVLRAVGVPAGGQRTQRGPDWPDADRGHRRRADHLGRRRPVRQAASAAVADHRRLRGRGGRPDAAAGPGAGALGGVDLGPRAAGLRRGHRRDADVLGERRPVQLPRARPGRHLGPVQERVQPGLLARDRRRGLDPGGGQFPGRAPVRGRPGHDGRHHGDRAGPGRADPPAAGQPNPGQHSRGRFAPCG